MFSGKCYEIFKDTYFEEQLRTAATGRPTMGNGPDALMAKETNHGNFINIVTMVYLRTNIIHSNCLLDDW